MAKKTITMLVDDLTKVYRSSEQLYVTLLDGNTPLSSKDVYFNINGVNYTRKTGSDGKAKLNINLESGIYQCTVTSFSDDEYASTSKNITITVIGSELIANDFSKVYGTSDALQVTLLFNNEPLINYPIQFTLNGVVYQRYTDNQGIAKLNIRLQPGEYDCHLYFQGDSTHDPKSKSIKVTVYNKKFITLLAEDFTKTYGNPDPFEVTLYYQSNPLINKEVYITINGITYTRITDNKGVAKLNINLLPGEYPTTVVTFSDSEYDPSTKNLKVTVKGNTRMEGTNITKTAMQTSVYQCAVYDFNNNRVDCDVSLTINGVTYIRHTDKEGLAKLNIRLREGEYTLKAEYKGDATHNPSSISNTVIVVPDITPLTKKADGNYTIPGNNRGFMESHIYGTLYGYDSNKKNSYWVTRPNWNEIIDAGNATDLKFTNYEITETDPRTKTAKFTSDYYMDLTRGHHWILIASPYHENFGGKILSVTYDKTNGLYTYQCQDGRRQYLSKNRAKIDSDCTIYDVLEYLLVRSQYTGNNLSVPLPEDIRKKYPITLSGLHPLKDYEIKPSPAIKPINNLAQKCPEILSFDSEIDKILNLSHYGQTPVDVYFTPDGICHLDPIDVDYWLNSGIKLTHSDLVHYKYGFDITNVLTGINVKDNNSSTYYKDWEELKFYFGTQTGLVDPVTTQTGGTSSGSSSSTSSGNGVVVNSATGLRDNSGANIAKNRPIVINIDNINGYSADKRVMEDCATALRNAGYSDVRVSGVGPGYHTSDITSGRVPNNGVAFTVYGGYCAGTFWDMCQPYIQNHVKNRGIQIVFGFTNMPNYRRSQTKHLDKLTWLPRAWDDNFSGLSGLSNPGQYITSRGIHYVYGDNGTELGQNLAGGNNGSSGSSSNTNSTTGSTTAVVDETATYNKALEEMSKSIRSLLSFEIRIPLNDPLFKKLHTNTMLWTELPSEFKLANLEKIFKILPSYKVNRGVSYQVNRWYVEKVVIKCDSNGLFADVTLNPFPSDYSVYHNAVKSYADAYTQAFKSTSETTTSNNTTISTVNNIPARTDGKTDCSSTYSLCCAHTGSTANPSNKGYEDRANAQGKIGKEGTNYAEFVKGCTPKEAYKKLASKHNYGNYRGYSDNAHACASNTLNASVSNCGDRARLLKACMDVLGQPCVIYHVYNHYMNGVLINGRWETVDLCYQSGSMPQYQTAGWNR